MIYSSSSPLSETDHYVLIKYKSSTTAFLFDRKQKIYVKVNIFFGERTASLISVAILRSGKEMKIPVANSSG